MDYNAEKVFKIYNDWEGLRQKVLQTSNYIFYVELGYVSGYVCKSFKVKYNEGGIPVIVQDCHFASGLLPGANAEMEYPVSWLDDLSKFSKKYVRVEERNG